MSQGKSRNNEYISSRSGWPLKNISIGASTSSSGQGSYSWSKIRGAVASICASRSGRYMSKTGADIFECSICKQYTKYLAFLIYTPGIGCLCDKCIRVLSMI